MSALRRQAGYPHQPHERVANLRALRGLISINDRGRYEVEDGFATTRLGRRLESLGKLLPRKQWDRFRETILGDAPSAVTTQWSRLSRPWQHLIGWGSGAAATILILCGLFSLWSSGDDAPREHAESLQVRAELACQALLLGDPAALSGLATRETQDDSARWLQRVRPPDWTTSSELAKTAQVELRTLFKSMKNNRAAVYFSIRAKAATEAPDVTGTLCWTLGHDGRWQLDARRTLDELSLARSTD